MSNWVFLSQGHGLRRITQMSSFTVWKHKTCWSNSFRCYSLITQLLNTWSFVSWIHFPELAVSAVVETESTWKGLIRRGAYKAGSVVWSRCWTWQAQNHVTQCSLLAPANTNASTAYEPPHLSLCLKWLHFFHLMSNQHQCLGSVLDFSEWTVGTFCECK